MLEEHTVHSKYEKKIRRLAEYLRPAAMELKAKCVSLPAIQNQMDLIRYWKGTKVSGPVVQLLKIIRYQTLVYLEGMQKTLESDPEILKTIVALCASEDETQSLSAANVVLLVLQTICPHSTVMPQKAVLPMLFGQFHETVGKVMSGVHVYLLQLICAAVDCCEESAVRGVKFAEEIASVSAIIHNSSDSSMTRVRLVHSVLLYVSRCELVR